MEGLEKGFPLKLLLAQIPTLVWSGVAAKEVEKGEAGAKEVENGEAAENETQKDEAADEKEKQLLRRVGRELGLFGLVISNGPINVFLICVAPSQSRKSSVTNTDLQPQPYNE
ncbi:Uncharacterized protein Fot_02372 [Forsythia ovata]|uniref:Uncharacterized protein n=1 Tax=Forsythia ovata TaxID=205694 RepID=A0ABD1X9M7_9LAMI